MAFTLDPQTGKITFGVVADLTHDAIARDIASEFGVSETFNDNFSINQGWTLTGAGVAITGGILDYPYQGDGTTQGASFDIQGSVISDTAWVMRFKLVITNITGTPASDAISVSYGIADIQTQSANTAVDGLHFSINKSNALGDEFYLLNTNSALPQQGSATNQQVFTTPPVAGTYFIELKRESATVGRATIFSDASYTVVTETQTVTTSASVISLRFINFAGRILNRTGVIETEIDNVQFWNGITVPVITSSNWRMRFELDITGLTTPSGADVSLWISLSDKDVTSDSNTVNDAFALAVFVDNIQNFFRIQTSDNQPPRTSGSDATMATTPTVNTFFIEMRRDSASQTTVTFYTDNTFTTISETKTQAGISGTDNLKYLKLFNDVLANNANKIDGTFDNFTFTNLVGATIIDKVFTVNALLKALGDSGNCGVQSFSQLKAYWNFDESSGDLLNQASAIGSVDALTGTKGQGTLNSITQNVAGQVGTAYDFTPPVAIITMQGIISDWNFLSTNTSTWTWNTWIDPDETGVTSQTLFNDRGTQFNNTGINLKVLKGATTWNTSIIIRAGTNNGFADTVTDGLGIPQDGQKHMLTITMDYAQANQNAKIYVDGVFKESLDKTNDTIGGNQLVLTLGRTGGGEQYDGIMDETSVWDRILTPTEILGVFTLNNAGIPLGLGKQQVCIGVNAILEQIFVACNQPLFSEDFSTSVGWVQTGSQVTISGGTLNGWGPDGTLESQTYDLQTNDGVTLSDTDWITEFKFRYTAVGTSTGHFVLGLANASGDIGAGGIPHASLFIHKQTGPDPIANAVLSVNDGVTAFLSTGIGIDAFISTDLFVRLQRVSTNEFKLSVFSDASFTTHIPNSPTTLTQASFSSIIGLDHIQSRTSTAGSATRNITGTIDNITITGGDCPTVEVDAVLVPIRVHPTWQFREHRRYGLFAVNHITTTEVASPNRRQINAVGGRGISYFFKVFDKSVVTGSDLAVTLERTQVNVAGTTIEVLDGSYNATSLVDFVNTGGRAVKGIGSLGSTLVLQGPEATVTIPAGSINYAGSTESHITVFVTHDDNDTGSSGSTFIRDVQYNGVCWIFDSNQSQSATVDITIQSGGRTNNITPGVTTPCVRFSVGAFLATPACSPWMHFDDQNTTVAMSFNFTYDDIAHEIPPVSTVTFVSSIKCLLASNSFQGSARMAIMPFPEPVDQGNASFGAVEGKLSSSISMSSLGGSLSTRTFTFSDPVRLEPGVRYGIRFVDNIGNSPGLTIGCFTNTSIPPTNRSNVIWRDPKSGTPARYIDVLTLDRQFAVDINVLNQDKGIICFLVGAILIGKQDPTTGLTLDWGYREQRKADNFNTSPTMAFFDEPPRANITAGGGLGQGYFLKTFKKSDITGSNITITWEGNVAGGGSGNQLFVFDGVYDRRENGDFNPSLNDPETGANKAGIGILGTLNMSVSGVEVTDILSAGSINYAGSTENEITIMVQVNDPNTVVTRNTKIKDIRVGPFGIWDFQNSVFTVEESGTKHDHGFLHVQSALSPSMEFEFTIDACVGLFGGFSRSRIGDIIIICLRLFPNSTGLEIVQHVNDYTQANGLSFVGKTSRVKNWIGFLEREGLIQEDNSSPDWYKTKWISLI